MCSDGRGRGCAGVDEGIGCGGIANTYGAVVVIGISGSRAGRVSIVGRDGVVGSVHC